MPRISWPRRLSHQSGSGLGSVPVVDSSESSDVRNVRLIVVGGEYFPSYDSFTGLGCDVMLNALRADQLFLSTTAVAGGDTCPPAPDQESTHGAETSR